MALRQLSRGAGRRFNPALAGITQRLFQTSSDAQLQQAHPQAVPMSKLKDSFLDGTSSTYLEELEERYRTDPKSVDKTWASFFRSLGQQDCALFPFHNVKPLPLPMTHDVPALCYPLLCWAPLWLDVCALCEQMKASQISCNTSSCIHLVQTDVARAP